MDYKVGDVIEYKIEYPFISWRWIKEKIFRIKKKQSLWICSWNKNSSGIQK